MSVTAENITLYINGCEDEADWLPDDLLDPCSEIVVRAFARIHLRMKASGESFSGIEEFDLDAESEVVEGAIETEDSLVHDLQANATVQEYLGCEFERDQCCVKNEPSRFQQLLLEESLKVLAERDSNAQ